VSAFVQELGGAGSLFEGVAALLQDAMHISSPKWKV
jgi:hypothetical protein